MIPPPSAVHPTGESSVEPPMAPAGSHAIDTFDGAVHLRWEPEAAVTPFGQMAYFIEFLKTSGLFEEWVADAPLTYRSPNAPQPRDVLGTLLLSVLAAFGTADGRLMALNAATGVPVTSFGDNGVVDMKVGVDNGFPDARLGLSSPPVVYKNLVITGARVQESPSLGMAGDTRAWDVMTGKMVWQFHSVPRPGETGHDTWEGDSWKQRSGVNVWGIMSVDASLSLVYLPHGSPTYDFYGADRAGANLFGNALVALDADTGELRWHFQTVHHDTWDYDLAAAPILFDVTREGSSVPAVGQL